MHIGRLVNQLTPNSVMTILVLYWIARLMTLVKPKTVARPRVIHAWEVKLVRVIIWFY